MRQVVLTGIREMEIREVPTPVIRTDADVLIRLKTVGVCGSDIHYYVDGKIGSQVVRYPFVVGHECSGIVEEVGAAVSRVKPGDLVAIDPSVHCGICDQCKAGRPHTCRNNKFMGCPGQLDGCLSDFVVMPEFACFPVDGRFTAQQAALVEPLTIGMYGVHQAQMDLAGRSIGIFGAGPIGLSVLMTVVTMQPGPVVVVEPLAYRLAKAAALGANVLVDPLNQSVASVVRTSIPEQLDVIFECSGSQKAIDDASSILKPGGKLVLIGIPAEGEFLFNMDLMRRNEISVQNVRRQNHFVEKAIAAIQAGLPVDEMVTHHFSFEQTGEAFDIVADYRDGVIKAMIGFD